MAVCNYHKFYGWVWHCVFQFCNTCKCMIRTCTNCNISPEILVLNYTQKNQWEFAKKGLPLMASLLEKYMGRSLWQQQFVYQLNKAIRHLNISCGKLWIIFDGKLSKKKKPPHIGIWDGFFSVIAILPYWIIKLPTEIAWFEITFT